MATAFIGVGSNLGEREHYLEAAEKMLRQESSIRDLQKSSVYETAPVGSVGQGYFLNSVWKVSTELSPLDLLKRLLAIEQKLGRKRERKNDPRTIDLDILFYDNAVIDEENLHIPHPRLHERTFVLKPMMELAPDWVHPVLRKTIREISGTVP